MTKEEIMQAIENMTVLELSELVKDMEEKSGRVRPSHQISLDIDLIAWGDDLTDMQFNPKKLPLATDVKIPMSDIWKHAMFPQQQHHFQTVCC